MDHYNALGVQRSASKEEIKQAFRRLALQFHPDKHADSPKSVRDGATLKFRQLSEAYEILSDERKRADYNIGRGSSGSRGSASSTYYYYYNNSGGNSRRYGYSGGAAADRGGSSSAGIGIKFEAFVRYLTTRSFRLNATFAGVLLGGVYIIDAGRDTLWKMQNSGKSFEEAMDSIEQAKALKEKT